MLVRLINTYVRPYRWLFVVVTLLQLVASMAALIMPNLNARIIDEGVAKGDTDYIWRTGAIMLAFGLAQGICQVVAVYLSARGAMGTGRDIRHSVFNKVLSFSTREVNTFGAPSLITRTTNDVQQVQMLIMMTGALLIQAPLMMTGGVIMALREDAQLSWVILVTVIALGICCGVLVMSLSPLFQKNQRLIDRINQIVREQITGIRVIRAFVREPTERKRFYDTSAELRELNVRIGTLFAILFPFVTLMMDGGSVAVTWFGAHRIDAGEMQVGQLTAFITYLMLILASVMMATMMVMMAPRAAVCARRIQKVLDTDTSVEEATDPVTELDERCTVTFDTVSFHYPGAEAPVLDDVSFEVKPGTTTAIIGSTGSGKTTLINLVPRLFDVTSGAVRINGIDVRNLASDAMWDRLGLVPQKPYLFSGTVRSNLAHGNPDATDDEMWEALRVAQAADFVEKMPDGLDSRIAQGGTNVSGGQRQRLSIARALVKKPAIYLFDDAFSALDVATDARLRRDMAPVVADSAVLIVAQRVSTIMDAEQIVVLDGGKVVGIGRHDDLVETCPTYAEIVTSQMSAEDAA